MKMTSGREGLLKRGHIMEIEEQAGVQWGGASLLERQQKTLGSERLQLTIRAVNQLHRYSPQLNNF